MNKKIPPVHPGEVLLEDFLKPWGIDKDALVGIIDGKVDVTPEIAEGLASMCNTTPELWINLQRRYDKEKTKQ